MKPHMHMEGHAYLVEGSAATLPALYEYLEARGIATGGNPDLFLKEYKSFVVEDAREVRDRAVGRAIGGKGRVFVIVTPGMTTEAQNALLKILEEPPAGATFFIVVPAPQTLIATLRSRAQVLALESTHDSGGVDVTRFLGATPEKRLDMLKPLYEHEDDERDMRGAVSFLQALERALAEKGRGEAREGIEAVYRARRYLGDKGALLKPLLEQVALFAPRV